MKRDHYLEEEKDISITRMFLQSTHSQTKEGRKWCECEIHKPSNL